MISRLTAYAVTTAAFAALLGACGGGSSGGNGTRQSHTVSVNVSGLSGSLALQLTPGGTALTVTGDGVSTFGTTVNSGAIYGVTVTSQPAGQYCAIDNNAGAVTADVTLSVTCNTSLGGIWKASANGTQYLEVADEMGDFYVLGTTSASVGYGVTLTELDDGLANVNNNAVSGTYIGVSGSNAGSGTLSGTIVSGSTLDLITQFSTSGGSISSQTLNYSYDSLYQVPSSLTAISSNYVDSENNVWSISGTGIANVDSPSTGCVGNGQVSIIDDRYNVYGIQLVYANCTGSSKYLNRLQLFGIVTLDTEVSPAVIIGGVAAALPSDQGELLLPFLLQSN